MSQSQIHHQKHAQAWVRTQNGYILKFPLGETQAIQQDVIFPSNELLLLIRP